MPQRNSRGDEAKGMHVAGNDALAMAAIEPAMGFLSQIAFGTQEGPESCIGHLGYEQVPEMFVAELL